MNEDYGGMIERGYSEVNGCLQFTVDFHRYNFDLLKKAVLKTLKEGYNEFSAKRFVTAFEKVEPLLFNVRFGRAYSPVVFLTLKHELDDEAVEQVRKAFLPTHFSEWHVGTDFTYNKCKTIRIWWD